MGLQVTITLVRNSLDEVDSLGMDRCSMLNFSKQIQVNQRNHIAMMPKYIAAEMVPVPRKEISPISAANCS
jgi:hypothetical protein